MDKSQLTEEERYIFEIIGKYKSFDIEYVADMLSKVYPNEDRWHLCRIVKGFLENYMVIISRD